MAKKQLFSITSISLGLLKSDPPQLSVTVSGFATTSGWSDPDLVPMEKKLSEDGILDLNFVATPPKGASLPVLTPITASTVWADDIERLVGVKVYSRTEDVVQLLDQAQQGAAVSVQGAPGQYTTLAIGEETPPTTLAMGEEMPTTKMRGEEGDPTTWAFGEEDPTTWALGEEGGPTTLAEGEEGPTTKALGEEGDPTTWLWGEEDNPTTLRFGEEGGPTTWMVGEEDDGPTTRALGEEGGPKPAVGETDPRVDDPKPPFGEGYTYDPGFRGPFGRRR